MAFGRAVLACYFTFIAVYYTAKLLALRARTGLSHAELGDRGTAQYVGQRLFRVFRVAIWALCVARVFWPGIDRALLPFAFMTGPASLATGLSLLLVCLALTVYVHSYMGEAWRSGVASAGPQHLITAGPFSHLRHPLFTTIAIGQLGFFLAFPSLFSLVCLAVGVTVLVIQARFEEQRMAAAFGQAWRDYAETVPAIVPRIGPGFVAMRRHADGTASAGPTDMRRPQ